eukprot:6271987-Alexandrium_andersonii.AAC.1
MGSPVCDHPAGLRIRPGNGERLLLSPPRSRPPMRGARRRLHLRRLRPWLGLGREGDDRGLPLQGGRE